MDDTLVRIANVTEAALLQRLTWPWLGGSEAADDPPTGAQAVAASQVGYVQHIDMEPLSKAAAKHGTDITLAILPGSLLHPGTPLASAHAEAALVLPEDVKKLKALLDQLRKAAGTA